MAENHTDAPKELHNRVEDGKLSLDLGNLYGGDSVAKQAGKAVV